MGEKGEVLKDRVMQVTEPEPLSDRRENLNRMFFERFYCADSLGGAHSAPQSFWLNYRGGSRGGTGGGGRGRLVKSLAPRWPPNGHK